MSARCPVCSKASIKEFKPFCSARCQDADLGNWVMEKYRVATPEEPEDMLAPPDEEDQNYH